MEIEAKFAVPDEATLNRLAQVDRLAGYTLLPAKIKRVHDTFWTRPIAQCWPPGTCAANAITAITS